jgi:hypothetical protein
MSEFQVLLKRALACHKGSQTRLAEAIGVGTSTLHNWIVGMGGVPTRWEWVEAVIREAGGDLNRAGPDYDPAEDLISRLTSGENSCRTNSGTASLVEELVPLLRGYQRHSETVAETRFEGAIRGMLVHVSSTPIVETLELRPFTDTNLAAITEGDFRTYEIRDSVFSRFPDGCRVVVRQPVRGAVIPHGTFGIWRNADDMIFRPAFFIPSPEAREWACLRGLEGEEDIFIRPEELLERCQGIVLGYYGTA